MNLSYRLNEFSFVLVLLLFTACGRAQEYQNVPHGDKPDALIGRWSLIKSSLTDLDMVLDVSDRTKMVNDSIKAYEKKGVRLSDNELSRINERIDELILIMSKNYLDFGPDGKITANVCFQSPEEQKPLEYLLKGIYEVDPPTGRFRIELPEGYEKPVNPAGSFHWYIKDGYLITIQYKGETSEMRNVYRRVES